MTTPTARRTSPPTRRGAARWALPLALLPLLAACDEFAVEDVTPQVRFSRVDVQQIDFEHVEADFVFAIDNPNPVEVPLSSFSWGLALEGSDLASGEDADGFTLQPLGSSEFALPVDLAWADAWETAQATRGEDYVDFGLDGHFGFETPIGEARIPYDAAGDFPALRTPRFRFERIRVASLSLVDQIARLEIDLAVDNPHRSTLFFDAVDYAVDLDGTQVATGHLDSLGSVDGADEGTLVLPVDVDLLGVGTTVVTALTQRTQLQVGLDATMSVDTPFGILPLDLVKQGQAEIE